MDIDYSLFKGNLKEFMSNSNFLIDAYSKEKLTLAEKQLDAHQKTIAFLEEEYANLKAE